VNTPGLAFKVCISLWTFAWACIVFEKTFWVESADLLTQLLADTCWVAATVALISLLCMGIFRARETRWHNTKFGSISTHAACSALALASIPCVFWYASKGLSFALSNMGAYDSAESLFRATRDPSDSSWHNSVASYLGCRNKDGHAHEVVTAAESVYGQSSPEMATIFLNQGLNCLTAGDIEPAVILLKKSLVIFQLNNDSAAKTYVLSQLTVCYLKQQNLSDAKRACCDALEIAANLAGDQAGSNEALSCLARSSRLVGFDEKANGLCDKCRWLEVATKNARVVQLLTAFAMFLFFSIGVPKAAGYIKTVAIERKIRLWMTTLECSKTCEAKFIALDMLASLELSRGNLGRADFLSYELLSLVQASVAARREFSVDSAGGFYYS
jgi:tetratricopeptide (TPR) repeat protein